MAVTFTNEQVQEIERLALINCNANTIAEAVGVAVNTLKRKFGRKMRHWRAMYRANLRESQNNLKETSADMCKFLGKNELGQTDKQIIETHQPRGKELTEQEREAAQASARAYNDVMSKYPRLKGKGA